jgi:hypothetical protein
MSRWIWDRAGTQDWHRQRTDLNSAFLAPVSHPGRMRFALPPSSYASSFDADFRLPISGCHWPSSGSALVRLACLPASWLCTRAPRDAPYEPDCHNPRKLRTGSEAVGMPAVFSGVQVRTVESYREHETGVSPGGLLSHLRHRQNKRQVVLEPRRGLVGTKGYHRDRPVRSQFAQSQEKRWRIKRQEGDNPPPQGNRLFFNLFQTWVEDGGGLSLLSALSAVALI